MYIASCCVLPSDLVLLRRSLPAKSTKFSLETVYLALEDTRDLVCNYNRFIVMFTLSYLQTLTDSSEADDF